MSGEFINDISLLDLSKKTGLQLDRVKSAIEHFNKAGLVISTERGIILCDLNLDNMNMYFYTADGEELIQKYSHSTGWEY